MVRVNIVSWYQGPPKPPTDGGDRKIPSDGPIYDANDLLKNIENIDISPWTRKCRADIQNLAFDEDDLKQLLKEALSRGRYIDSEWCQQSSKVDSPWAACDAYIYEREESLLKANGTIKVTYFLKFSLAKTGNVVLTISCHLSS